MYKLIPLTQGKFTVVDNEDYCRLHQWKWHAHKNKCTFYAERVTKRKNGKRKVIKMHRVILNVPLGLESDHINGNGLDNRKTNLRLSTPHNNCFNQRKHPTAPNKYKCVYKTRYKRKDGRQTWFSTIMKNGKAYFLGTFENEIDAAKAYDRAAKALFGEFAWLNFPAKPRQNNNG